MDSLLPSARRAFTEVLWGAALSFWTASWAVPLGYKLRGYEALGGEGLLIFVSALAGVLICRWSLITAGRRKK